MDVAGVGQLTKGNSLSRGSQAQIAMRWSCPVCPLSSRHKHLRKRRRGMSSLYLQAPVALAPRTLLYTTLPALQHSRLSKNGLNLPPPVSTFIIIEWYRSFVRKMASVIFIQQQSTASFSLGRRVAMATPAVQSVLAEDTLEACLCSSLLTVKCHFALSSTCSRKFMEATCCVLMARTWS